MKRTRGDLLTFVLLISVCVLHITAAASDFYKTLGVRKDSSAAEIKKAYRKLALKHHPDKGGTESRFKEISEAYETLSDEERRKLYDQHGQAGFDPRFAQQGAGGPQSEFFTYFNPQQQQGGQPQQEGMPSGFTFEQFSSSFGNFGSSTASMGEILREMMGQGGTSAGARFNPGRSSFTDRQQAASQKQKFYVRPAPCSLEDLATGAIKKFKVNHPVSVNGHIESKVYEVQLKKGWKAGTKIKFPPKGGFPGIVFVVEEKEHPFMERVGDDLVYRCKVTSKQAAAGVKISIPLPDGEVLTVKAHKDELPIQEGQILTVPSKGGVVSKGQEVVPADIGSDAPYADFADGFRNFDSCLRRFYMMLLPAEQEFRNLIVRRHIFEALAYFNVMAASFSHSNNTRFVLHATTQESSEASDLQS